MRCEAGRPLQVAGRSRQRRNQAVRRGSKCHHHSIFERVPSQRKVSREASRSVSKVANLADVEVSVRKKLCVPFATLGPAFTVLACEAAVIS